MNIDITNYLRLNPNDMILILISTLLICLIAKKYFWKPALNYLDKRQALIAEELSNAKKAEKDALELKEQYANRIKEAHEESSRIVEEARQNAKNEGALILEKAQNDAKLTLEKARRDVSLEKANAQKQIKKEITEVAFLAAGKILEKEIDDSKQKDYVAEFIDQVGE